jgi:hypothetical protein
MECELGALESFGIVRLTFISSLVIFTIGGLSNRLKWRRGVSQERITRVSWSPFTSHRSGTVPVVKCIQDYFPSYSTWKEIWR